MNQKNTHFSVKQLIIEKFFFNIYHTKVEFHNLLSYSSRQLKRPSPSKTNKQTKQKQKQKSPKQTEKKDLHKRRSLLDTIYLQIRRHCDLYKRRLSTTFQDVHVCSAQEESKCKQELLFLSEKAVLIAQYFQNAESIRMKEISAMFSTDS